MKKLLLSLVIAGAALTASAQTNSIKIGVKAGATFATMSVSGDDDGALKSNTGYYVGGTVDLGINDMFTLQPGLILSKKGAKANVLGITASLNFTYIEIPVNALVNIPVGDGKVFVGAGPYYGMAIRGKNKLNGSIDGESISESEDLKFGDDGDFKRGDFGVNFLAGYQLNNGFNIHGGYGLGLSNISRDSDADVKNRVFSVGIGFSF